MDVYLNCCNFNIENAPMNEKTDQQLNNLFSKEYSYAPKMSDVGYLV